MCASSITAAAAATFLNVPAILLATFSVSPESFLKSFVAARVPLSEYSETMRATTAPLAMIAP